jgi:hypothetical protein
MRRLSKRLGRWLAWGVIVSAASVGSLGLARAQGIQPALELVLAMDASSSVSAEEFELQRRGLSEAFRHPEVVAAVRATGDAGVAVAVVQWSGARFQRKSVDWTLVHDAASAGELAATIAASERLLRGGTSLGGAIRFSLTQLEQNRFHGRRKVIDVSGDGFAGLSPRRERDRALARGVTINGLAIENEEPGLGRYYADHVVGGSGAFVVVVKSFVDFAVAIREKLIKEIAGSVVAAKPGSERLRVPEARTDAAALQSAILTQSWQGKYGLLSPCWPY